MLETTTVTALSPTSGLPLGTQCVDSNRDMGFGSGATGIPTRGILFKWARVRAAV